MKSLFIVFQGEKKIKVSTGEFVNILSSGCDFHDSYRTRVALEFRMSFIFCLPTSTNIVKRYS